MTELPQKQIRSDGKDVFFVAVGAIALAVPLVLLYATDPVERVQFLLSVIAALGAGFWGGAIPGVLELKLPFAGGAGAPSVRAAGALGVFVLVLWLYPKTSDMPRASIDDAEVRQFADGVVLPGSDDDVNASQWATVPGAERFGSVIGSWRTRWRYDLEDANQCWWTGHGDVRLDGGILRITFSDVTGQYVIEAKEDSVSGLLVGRYWSELNRDTTPWVGRIVNKRRIDGLWEHGRMDLRR